MLYLWVKAFHTIFVVAWIAAMLIFPRYKLHQIKSKPGEPLFEEMSVASLRLRNIIMSPSMVLVWGLGLTMLWLNPELLSQGWIQAKLALVLLLSALHGYMIALGQKIDSGAHALSPGRLKVLNEVPFVILILVVILVIVKPF